MEPTSFYEDFNTVNAILREDPAMKQLIWNDLNSYFNRDYDLHESLEEHLNFVLGRPFGRAFSVLFDERYRLAEIFNETDVSGNKQFFASLIRSFDIHYLRYKWMAESPLKVVHASYSSNSNNTFRLLRADNQHFDMLLDLGSTRFLMGVFMNTLVDKRHTIPVEDLKDFINTTRVRLDDLEKLIDEQGEHYDQSPFE